MNGPSASSVVRAASPSRAMAPEPHRSPPLRWLWPAAATALVVLIVQLWQPFAGKGGDLLQYLAQGTVVPLLLLAYVVLERRIGSERLRAVRTVLGDVAALAAAAFLIRHLSLAAVLLTCAQLAVASLVLRAPFFGRKSLHETAPVAFFLLTAWSATLTLVWWGPPAVNPVALIDGSISAPHSTLYALSVIAVVVAVLSLCVRKFYASHSPRCRWRRWLPLAAAAAVFAYASLQTLGLQDPGSATTWGFYVGPAELVRQGGWLMWDVPSQYGFLSVLFIAWMPLHSVWESLFILNAGANVAIALLVYWVLRRRGAGLLDWVASVLIAVAVVYLRTGLSVSFAGPPVYPSTGGYRFVFCVGLLAVLLRIAREPDGRVPARWLVTGTALWLVSLAWSAEAALYATATWIPAYVLLVWFIAKGNRGLRLRMIAAPFAAAACAVGIVAATYMLALGHLPDVRAYIEYATAYSEGFGSLVADPAGPALALIFGLAVLGSLWVWSSRRDGLARPTTAFFTGAFLAAWTTSSYFATRSHPNNAVNVAPIFVVCLAGALQLTARAGAPRAHADLRAMLIPVVGALMIGTLGDVNGVLSYVQNPPAAVASVQSLFWNSPDLTAFMSAIGIPRSAPVAVIDDPITSVLPPQDDNGAVYWLPLAPYGEIDLLPLANRLAHIERYVDRHHMSGWLIVDRAHAADGAWLPQALMRWYVPVRTVSQGNRIATYFRYRGQTP